MACRESWRGSLPPSPTPLLDILNDQSWKECSVVCASTKILTFFNRDRARIEIESSIGEKMREKGIIFRKEGEEESKETRGWAIFEE